MLVELLGLSFIAGFIGAFFMTISQEIELRFIAKRPISFSPAIAFFKIFDFDFEVLSGKDKILASYAVHFAYGTVWGFPLALLYFFGYKEPVLVLAIYLPIILIQGWVALWVLGISDFPWKWGHKAVFIELVHKIVYSVIATISFMILLN